MEFVVGILLLLSFFGLAYYCVKGHNLMIGSVPAWCNICNT